jgi:hypothetical protein
MCAVQAAVLKAQTYDGHSTVLHDVNNDALEPPQQRADGPELAALRELVNGDH